MQKRRGSWAWVFRLVVIFVACTLVTLPLFAQGTNGTFTGVVVDPSNAVIPGATVTITNLGTNLVTTVNTDASGTYRAGNLPIGTYNIMVAAKGFKTSLRPSVGLDAGAVEAVNFTLQLGAATTTVEVTAGAPLVQTSDTQLYQEVSGTQIANLPLNGRNVYDLMQLQAGAVNVMGVDAEGGHHTVINGLRPDFIGFLLNGTADKGLSGGVDTVVNPDLIAQFQQLSLNMSAQYGNSAAGIVNVVTKHGTNHFHGSAYEFIRNDKLDANYFFNNATGAAKSPLRFNQFGVTAEGPIIKNHLFFTGSYQGERFITNVSPVPVLTTSSAWNSAITSAFPNSVAALIYKNFPTKLAGVATGCGSDPTNCTVSDYVAADLGATGLNSFAQYECAANYPHTAAGNYQYIAANMQRLFGVAATDDFSTAWVQNLPPSDTTGAPLPCPTTPAVTGATALRSQPMLTLNTLQFGTQASGNLFNGNEMSGRIDWQRGNDRLYGEYYWQSSTDKYGASNTSSGIHGFINPQNNNFPHFSFSYVHVFNPNLLNEFRAGYVRSANNISVATPGVPSISLDDGAAGFGSYNGYPQFFHENVYSYSDMVSITKGNHDLKFGGDVKRNLENSEFNVARPSYEFGNAIFFSQDAPYFEVAGVDPGFASGQPASLSSNVRYWRNLEFGAYFQDDWKLRRNLTLYLGLRYDLYTRHTEKYGRVTTFIPGPGALTKGNGYYLDWIANANAPAGTAGCTSAVQLAESQLAGICGPGGFAVANSLGAGNHKNFGPRLGFAWDPSGNGKMSIRGGFGISYEGTLYNPLSNSRWNLPFYSFNEAFNNLAGGTSTVIYGPAQSAGTNSATGAPITQNVPYNTGTPTFTGAGPAVQYSGSGAQNTGNIIGWDPNNPNQAVLTGIVFPTGLRDPRIYNYYFGIQRQVLPNTVLEVDYVGTEGRYLFRAENGNRAPGGALPEGTCVQAQGRQECSLVNSNPGVAGTNISEINPLGRLNPNYGTLRIWSNVSRSNYNSLQVSLRHQMSHGLLLNFDYTYAHSLDTGSTWHSGATTANGAAAGEGYSLDPTRPNLDYGNSIFDIRHRVAINYVYELPWFKSQNGLIGHILGGWEYNGLWTFQSGSHWEPYCGAGGPGGACDFNADGVVNDRPNAGIGGRSYVPSRQQWANGWFTNGATVRGANSPWCSGGNTSSCTGFFNTPCAGCDGNLARNSLVGPGIFDTDESVFKDFKVRENMSLQFRAEFFNAFNRANFTLPNSAAGNNANRITSGIFGQANGTLDPREIQFGLKLLW